MTEEKQEKKESKPKKKKKKRLRGFAGLISKQLGALNDNEKFKRVHRDTELKILLNAKDGKQGCLIIIDHGKIDFEAVKNTPKENIKKKNLGWDALLETTMPIFLQIAMGKLSTWGMVKKILGRKMKVRGVKKLLVLNGLFNMLNSK